MEILEGILGIIALLTLIMHPPLFFVMLFLILCGFVIHWVFYIIAILVFLGIITPKKGASIGRDGYEDYND